MTADGRRRHQRAAFDETLDRLPSEPTITVKSLKLDSAIGHGDNPQGAAGEFRPDDRARNDVFQFHDFPISVSFTN